MSGFKLYEIDGMLREALEAAEAVIDPETGEVPDDWASFLDAVQYERNAKCLAVAAYIRECLAEAEAIKTEVMRLMVRSRTAENRAESMKDYLSRVVKVGEKMKDNTVTIGWRKSEAVVVDDPALLPESCWRVMREVSKTAVKDALKAGALKAGAHIEQRNNLQVR